MTEDTQQEWLAKMIKRQEELDSLYDEAHNKLADAYNEFLMAIDEVNFEYGTEFTFQQAAIEFQGEFAFSETPIEDDEDDEDED